LVVLMHLMALGAF